MTNEMTKNSNEVARSDKPDYSHFYDRLEPEYVSIKNDGEERRPWTKERIIEKVENEGWSLREGRGGGVTITTSRGWIIPGSPPPMPRATSVDPFAEEVAEVRQALMNVSREMNTDVEFLGALITAMNKGNVQAMKLYADIFVIPKPVQGPTLSAKTVNVSYNSQPEKRSIKEI